MLELILLLSAGLHQAVPTAQPENPQVPSSEAGDEAAKDEGILVEGRRVICKRQTANSAGSRLGQTQTCLTSREWTLRRDDHIEFYDDLPRRNPRKGPSSTAGPN